VRSEAECVRIAVTECYGQRYGFGFDDTPDATGEAQAGAWEAWAEERGMEWWYSDELAPVGMPRWLAFVPSRLPDAKLHAVVMRYGVVQYDPPLDDAEPWPEVHKEDVLSARMLLRDEDPTWGREIQYWPINEG
jgi:hypothetical protein